MMLSLDRQEKFRRRYARTRAGWQPGSHVYRDLVAASLSPGARVLDLGCGRGGVMEELHRDAGLAIGLDPDPSSLGEHRAPLAVPLVCGLGEALPYPEGEFDLVCCSWVLEHLEIPGRVFSEAHRVLGPDGRFVFLTPNARHPLLVLNRGLRWTRGRWVARLYDRSDRDTFPAYYRANTANRIRRLAAAAGFVRVSVRFIGDPTYLAFNELSFGLAQLLERLTPRSMRVHLVGLCVRS